MQQVKSKERIQEHGEVFTDDREVNAMIDLVAEEASQPATRFLEPSCGTGNFLVAILQRKLKTVFEGRLEKYDQYALTALASLYGIDILPDNTIESRKRLLDTFKSEFEKSVSKSARPHVLAMAAKIVEQNIICGDFLSGKDNLGKLIIITEWAFPDNDLVSRREFLLGELKMAQQTSLFTCDWLSDDGDTSEKYPKAIKEYPQTSYLSCVNKGESL